MSARRVSSYSYGPLTAEQNKGQWDKKTEQMGEIMMADKLGWHVSRQHVHLDSLQKVPTLKTRLKVERSVCFSGKSGVLNRTSASADA